MYGPPKTVIEIGCFEGLTTFGLTELLSQQNPSYKHYAIDPYDMSDDLSLDVLNEAGQLFMSNLEEFKYKNNVEFIHDTSWNGLLKLLHRGVKADLIYIDGDHRAETVLNDLVLAVTTTTLVASLVNSGDPETDGVNAINACNGGDNLTFTVHKGADHGDLEKVFRTDEMYDWMFKFTNAVDKLVEEKK
jgi:hypothetical protein